VSDGDVIESIGNQSTRELSLAVIRLMLEGKPGSTIALSVVRPAKPDPDHLTLTRAVVEPPGIYNESVRQRHDPLLKPGALTPPAWIRLRRRSRRAQGRARSCSICAILAAMRSRACGWPTSSSKRGRWPRCKASSSQRRPSPRTRGSF
jgi:hypothetical protein